MYQLWAKILVAGKDPIRVKTDAVMAIKYLES